MYPGTGKKTQRGSIRDWGFSIVIQYGEMGKFGSRNQGKRERESKKWGERESQGKNERVSLWGERRLEKNINLTSIKTKFQNSANSNKINLCFSNPRSLYGLRELNNSGDKKFLKNNDFAIIPENNRIRAR